MDKKNKKKVPKVVCPFFLKACENGKNSHHTCGLFASLFLALSFSSLEKGVRISY